MTQIVTGLAAGGLAPPGMPYHSRVHVLPDGYRALVYAGSSAFKLAVSQNGTSAWNTTTPINGTTAQIATSTGNAGGLMGTYVDSCLVVGTAPSTTGLYVFILTSARTAVNVYWMAYRGGGAFGAVQTASIIGYGQAPLSIRALYDPAGLTVDSQHIAGTAGLVHILADIGPYWIWSAVDVNTSAAAGVKNIASQTVPVGVASPTGNTNAILRKPNTLYGITPGFGASGWTANETVWQGGGQVSTTTTYGGTAATQADTGYLMNAATTKPTAGNFYRYPSGTVAGGTGLTLEGPTQPANYSTWGYTLGTYLGGYTVPAGNWWVSLPVTCTNLGGATVSPSIRFYELTAGGAKNYIGAIPRTASGDSLSNSGIQAITGIGSLPAYTFAAGSNLYMEVDLHVLTAPSGAGPFTLQKGPGSIQVTNPTPSLTTTATVADAYVVGAIEHPAMQPQTVSPGMVYGAALALADVTPDPGLMLFHSNNNGTTGWIASYYRSSAGVYSNYVNLPGAGPAAIAAPAAMSDPVTGNLALLYLNSAGTHVQSMQRSSGVWGTPAQWDTSPTNVEEFVGVSGSALHTTGQAAAYLNSTPSAYTAQYEDKGFAAGAGVPSVTSLNLSPQYPGGWQDAVGATQPFTALTTTPTFGAIYNEALAGDTLAGYRMLITLKSSGATVNDSGWIPWNSGVVPGGSFTIKYGQWAASSNVTPSGSIAALSAGVEYNVQLQVTERVGGNVGGKPGAAPGTYTDPVTFQIFTPPSIVDVTGPVLGSPTASPVLAYAQVQYVPASVWDFTLLSTALASLYHSSGSFSTPYQPSGLSAGTTVGSNQLVVQHTLTLNSYIWLEPGTANAERKQVTGGPTGTGPYTYTVDSNWGIAHPNGSLVHVEIPLPNQNLTQIIQNGSSYLERTLLWGYPGSGYPPLFGHLTQPIAVQIAVPPQPTGLTNAPVTNYPSSTDGGYMLLGWTQPAPGGGQAAVTDYLVQQRASGTTAWTVVGTLPAGTTSLRLYSIPNSQPIDVQVIPRQADQVQGPAAEWDALQMALSGIWINDPTNPRLTVNLRQYPGDQPTLPSLTPTKDLVAVNTYNRPTPLHNRGVLYARKANQLTYILPSGQEAAIKAIMLPWDQRGGPFQIRWPGGEVLYMAFNDVIFGYLTADIQTVTIDVEDDDPGTYGPLMA